MALGTFKVFLKCGNNARSQLDTEALAYQLELKKLYIETAGRK